MTAPLTADGAQLKQLYAELDHLAAQVVAIEAELAPRIAAAHNTRQHSARNLAHYVALRRHELRELQTLLQDRGLSSLGRSESCVLANLVEVTLRVAESLCVRGACADDALVALRERRDRALDPRTAKHLLHRATRDLLGPRPPDRHVSIMVTAPDADTADEALLTRLLRGGMTVLRINCAHESPVEWRRVIDALTRAREATGLPCRVYMDLAGPKIRTGPVDATGAVVHLRPTRDAEGRVIAPLRLSVRPVGVTGDPGVFALALPPAVFGALREGDRVRLDDTRDKRRTLTVATVGEREAVLTSARSLYLREGARVRLRRGGHTVLEDVVRFGAGVDAAIPLRAGDVITVTAGETPGAAARDGAPAHIACTLPEALRAVKVGHRVLFDDGKVKGVAEAVSDDGVTVRVERTSGPRVKLRAEKGINLPDTRIPVPCLTEADLAALDFVVAHADVVGVSFVRSAHDLRRVHEALDLRGRGDMPLTAKIETREGFAQLPSILFEGLRRPTFGVMIARGDLAVEVGFERLAELQEEILWLCEASHVPAIWATQVLDTLARTGVPSRAEVSDAAMSVGAECVMLNKGPHIEGAVEMLASIIRRMERHRYKKRSMFRRLEVTAMDEAPPPAAR